MRSEVQVLPKQFLERLKKIIPSHKWDTTANMFAENKPTTFRVNTLKMNAKEVREKIEHLGFRLECVPWFADAFILRDGRLRELQETEIYKKGEIYVQSLPSMIPPLVLDPQPGEEVLDLTAAPGSKTTQMAAMMRNTGRILANDNNKIRFYKLKANLEQQGCAMVEPMLRYGEALGRNYPARFNRVLLDAPCSAEGRFDVHEPSSYQYWKPSKVHEMAQKQKKLIISAVDALKAGGLLVYSTCTYAPEENEGVIQFALEKFGATLKIEEIKFPILNQMSGLGAWEGKSFDPAIRKSIRILPTPQMEGFFVVKLKKISK